MKLDRCPMNEEEKKHIVATAAYMRFAGRGFSDADPAADWLAAEAEIEAAIETDCRLAPRKKMSDFQRWGLKDTVVGWWRRLLPKTAD